MKIKDMTPEFLRALQEFEDIKDSLTAILSDKDCEVLEQLLDAHAKMLRTPEYYNK